MQLSGLGAWICEKEGVSPGVKGRMLNCCRGAQAVKPMTRLARVLAGETSCLLFEAPALPWLCMWSPEQSRQVLRSCKKMPHSRGLLSMQGRAGDAISMTLDGEKLIPDNRWVCHAAAYAKVN